MKKAFLVVCGVVAVSACGSSQPSSGPSSGSSGSGSTTSAGAGGGGGGGSQLSVTGALTATLGSPHCYDVGSIHAIDATGKTSDGTSLKLTVTNEQDGKASLITGSQVYVFTRVSGSLKTTGTSATFSDAKLVTIGNTSSVIVNGTISC
jgi:hypothetical protein